MPLHAAALVPAGLRRWGITLGLLLVSGAAAADRVELQPIAFGLSESAVVRILGEPSVTERRREPGLAKVCSYRLNYGRSRDEGATISVHYNRSYEVAEVRVGYYNHANSGNDPRTGRTWNPPPGFEAWALQAVGRAGDWQRINPGVWRNPAARASARSNGHEIVIRPAS